MPERARGTLGAATVVVKVAVVAHLDRLPGDRFAGEVKGPRTKVEQANVCFGVFESQGQIKVFCY